MKVSHKGMKISESDQAIFLDHAGAAMQALQFPQNEADEILEVVLCLKDDIVEA
jgi:hemoglobin